MFPTTVLVWTLQWNSSVLLCLWHFWSSVRWSGISQQRHKSHKWRAETFCLSAVMGGVLHGRTFLYTLQREAMLKRRVTWMIFLHTCVLLWIYTYIQRHTRHCQSDWMSAVILDSASLKTTVVDLIVALEEMSGNHQVPQDLSSGYHGYL